MSSKHLPERRAARTGRHCGLVGVQQALCSLHGGELQPQETMVDVAVPTSKWHFTDVLSFKSGSILYHMHAHTQTNKNTSYHDGKVRPARELIRGVYFGISSLLPRHIQVPADIIHHRRSRSVSLLYVVLFF